MNARSCGPNIRPILYRFARDVWIEHDRIATVVKSPHFLPSKRQGPGRKPRLAN